MKPNILFLCIDSLRADRCYGKTKSSKTPNIDLLIKSGTYFSQAIGTTDYTVPAMESIFTAVFPFNASDKSEIYYKSISKTTNYIKILKDFGYNVHATIPKSFSNLGFTNHFENKDEIERKRYSDKSRLFTSVGQKIIRNLENNRLKEPWLYYIHIDDLHKGSKPPKEFDNEEFGNDSYDRIVSSIDVWIEKILEKIDLNRTLVILTADHGDYIRSINVGAKSEDLEFQFFAEIGTKIGLKTPLFIYPHISKLLAQIRKILTDLKLRKLKQKNLTFYQNRSIFFTRNNPERYLYDEIVHVPLILTGYGISAKNPISQQIRSVDIFPTIAELIGIPDINNFKNGKSLVPLLKDKEFEEKFAYLESATFPITKEFQESVKPVIGVRTLEYKYFKKIKNPMEKYLYDLKNDPLEENNIAGSKPNIVNEMERILTKIRENIPIENKQEKMSYEETKKVEQELRKLGYI